MLRLLIAVSLRLLIVFTGIGLLLSRTWGWSEYASPELYLIYVQIMGNDSQYFMVNTDGSGEQWQLQANPESLSTLTCSPDGRTLAFVTVGGHFEVVRDTGILYQGTFDSGGTWLGTLANDGTLTHLATLRDAHQSEHLTPPAPDMSKYPYPLTYNDAVVASSGVSIWYSSDDKGIKLLSPSGDLIADIPEAYDARWFASEQVVSYRDQMQQTALLNPLYFVDATTGLKVRRNYLMWGDSFSPDATQYVGSDLDSATGTRQLFLANAFSSIHTQQLTHNIKGSVSPYCFLIFRPQMLIAGS